MLKFEESDRPSFVELAKLVLTSTENSIESGAKGNHNNEAGSKHNLAAKRMSGAKMIGGGGG